MTEDTTTTSKPLSKHDAALWLRDKDWKARSSEFEWDGLLGEALAERLRAVRWKTTDLSRLLGDGDQTSAVDSWCKGNIPDDNRMWGTDGEVSIRGIHRFLTRLSEFVVDAQAQATEEAARAARERPITAEEFAVLVARVEKLEDADTRRRAGR